MSGNSNKTIADIQRGTRFAESVPFGNLANAPVSTQEELRVFLCGRHRYMPRLY